ncbi:MAG: hypothetical protein HY707_09070 [Ignavibacteriae bacterium]|nr:hypothetical protein [Ignavibacteriota bacterium]
MKSSLVFIFMLVFFIIGCEKKLEPVPVGEMNEYRDPAYGFKIKYPKEWLQLGTAGKAVFARSQEVVNKFIDPQSGEAGAQVMAEIVQYGGKSPEELVQAGKEKLKQTWQNIEVQTDVPVTVGGKQATKVPYAIPVTLKTKIMGYEVYVPGDTALYRLDFVGFGDHFQAHAAVFDAMLNSFELPVIVVKRPDVWQPSPSLETYKSNYFTMQYPDNLEFVTVKKGDKDLAMEMRADRLDCSIHIDVFGAKGLTVDKVWEQNKGNYKAKNTGTATIDANKAHWVDYVPPRVKDINSRAYFVVKNDKVVRIILNWYAPQKDAYFPVFERCVTSIKLK